MSGLLIQSSLHPYDFTLSRFGEILLRPIRAGADLILSLVNALTFEFSVEMNQELASHL